MARLLVCVFATLVLVNLRSCDAGNHNYDVINAQTQKKTNHVNRGNN